VKHSSVNKHFHLSYHWSCERKERNSELTTEPSVSSALILFLGVFAATGSCQDLLLVQVRVCSHRDRGIRNLFGHIISHDRLDCRRKAIEEE
jgi:hypothetical protein